jgi:50S ribosomal subunit-associated GTPase HflX
MARALMGHIGSPGEQALALEIGRLRRRVRELETELDELRKHTSASAAIDLELHRLAEAGEPALA